MMSSKTVAVILAGMLVAPPTLAVAAVSHSGTITAIDAAKHTLRLDEMGSWGPHRHVVVHRTVSFGLAHEV